MAAKLMQTCIWESFQEGLTLLHENNRGIGQPVYLTRLISTFTNYFFLFYLVLVVEQVGFSVTKSLTIKNWFLT